MILYSPPTLWGLLRGAAINLLLPFVNGLMLGFGELFAHEAAFRLGWGGTKVRQPFTMLWKGSSSWRKGRRHSINLALQLEVLAFFLVVSAFVLS